MTIKEYREFVLVAAEGERDPQGLRQIVTQVFNSPAGEGEKEVRPAPADLWNKWLYRLENRRLDVAAIISLGEVLADLLLPDQARKLFERSLDKLQPDQGLRLRLRLAPTLVDIPWEYLYIQRGRGEKDTTGFLVLDPRLSLVRHEALPVSGDLDFTPRPRRLLAALASPEEPGYDPLDLAKERDNLKKALKDVPGIELDLLEPATVQGLSDELLRQADIFHFAGHGGFKQTGLGGEIGSIRGQGEIFLVDAGGGAAPWPADQLAVNLQGHGVQLAVLGACQTGRRDGQNIWSGVVAALLEVGIPGVVAMQDNIWDESAIAFSHSFYQALAAGLTLDEAVVAGRLATFNLVHPSREDASRGRFWHDSGVPVLYLRSEQTFVLPAIIDATQRQTVAAGLAVMAEQRIQILRGKATVAEVDTIAGGTTILKQDIGTVESGGEATALKVGSIGSSTAPAGTGAAVEPAPAAGPEPSQPMETSFQLCPKCQNRNDVDAKSCSSCGAPVVTQLKFCQQCGAKLAPGAKFCDQCGHRLR